MPIYEYECEACGRVVEAWQKHDDPAPESCECGAKGTLKRRLSATAFVFKGNGFYSTDYRKRPTESAGSGESESKPAAHPSGCSCCSAAPSCPSAKP